MIKYCSISLKVTYKHNSQEVPVYSRYTRTWRAKKRKYIDVVPISSVESKRVRVWWFTSVSHMVINPLIGWDVWVRKESECADLKIHIYTYKVISAGGIIMHNRNKDATVSACPERQSLKNINPSSRQS